MSPAPGGAPARLRLSVVLVLPRDRASVPLARHLLCGAMQSIGVLREDADAVALVVSEACANVVAHAARGDEFEVSVVVGDDTCELLIVDHGRGWEEAPDPTMPGFGAEHGRGYALMSALVDEIDVESNPDAGTIVHAVKHLGRPLHPSLLASRPAVARPRGPTAAPA